MIDAFESRGLVLNFSAGLLSISCCEDGWEDAVFACGPLRLPARWRTTQNATTTSYIIEIITWIFETPQRQILLMSRTVVQKPPNGFACLGALDGLRSG